MIKFVLSTVLFASAFSVSAVAGNEAFVIAKSQLDAGDYRVSAASLKDMGLAVLNTCENLSADDDMELEYLVGTPGQTDFKAAIYRKSNNEKKTEMVRISAEQNLDVPFNVNYDIDCLKRNEAIRDQSSFHVGSQRFSQGSIKDLMINSAKLGNVVIATEVESDEVEFKEVQAVLVSYKQVGANGQVGLYEHTQALPMNKMSKAFVQKVLAANGNLKADELVTASKTNQIVKSKELVCVEHKQVRSSPSIDDPYADTLMTVCAKYKEVEVKTTYDVIGLIPKI